MAEYVSKSTLYALCGKRGITYLHVSDIDNMPADDVAPVVPAMWVWNPNGMDYELGAWQCGRCFTRNNNLPMNNKINPLMFTGSKYCPECGAKMNAEQEE